MFFIPVIAAIGASLGWATGIVLAQTPACKLGAFEFTRIQLVACSAIVTALCSALGYWQSVIWSQWPLYVISICIGIVLGNLAMIECLRFGGPRRTELLLSLKAPIVGLFAYFWLGETLSLLDIIGIAVILTGVCLAIVYGNEDAESNVTFRDNAGRVLLLGFSAATFQGLGFLVMKPALLSGAEPLAVASIRLLGAAFLISIVALWPLQAFRAKVEMTPVLLMQTILPGFIGYVVSSSLMLYAYANLEAGIAAVLGSLSPVLVLVIIGLKERKAPNPYAATGAIVAVLGVSVLIMF